VEALLALTVAMTVRAQPVMRYMDATARALERPQLYIEGVLGAPRVIEETDGDGKAAEGSNEGAAP
jgi:hypothetical protein